MRKPELETVGGNAGARIRGGAANRAPERTGPAVSLAYLAAAPLVASAMVVVARPGGGAATALQFMQLYGAALIVFFGGVRWGVAVMKPEGPTFRSLIGAGAPLALALPLFLPVGPALALPALMALTLALLIDDLGATRRGSGAPVWYLGVRAPLTALIEVAYLAALAGLWRAAA